MYPRLLKKPLSLNKSFFLFGPRGTGKTTWLKKHLTNSIYIDLLQANTYQELLARPGLLKNYITDSSKWIVLDEIQKIPALLNEVHHLIETEGYKFILTGSSSRSLRKKGTNLLAGRALLFHMFPLTAIELGTDFDLEKSLKHGHLPIICQDPNPEETLDAYIQTYLREEVLQEGVTRNIGNFVRVLEVVSFSQGCVLNTSAVARDAMVERKVVEGYICVLEDLLIAKRLPVFTKKAKRRMISHSKFYFVDVGIFQAIRPRGLLDAPEQIEGPALETLCFQELLAINEYLDLKYQLYFWRTSTGHEVDFILYGPRGFLAIEIKRGTKVNNTDLKGLNAFKRDFPESKLHLFYCGVDELIISGVKVTPISKALKELAQILC